MNVKFTTEYMMHKHPDRVIVRSRETGRLLAQWDPEGLQVSRHADAHTRAKLDLYERKLCMFAFDMSDEEPQPLTFEGAFEIQRTERAGCHILETSGWVATWTPQGLETPHLLPNAYSSELCHACYKLVTE